MHVLCMRDCKSPTLKQLHGLHAHGGRGGARLHPEALGLEGEPQLELVGGEAHEVLGGVVTGGRVEADRARALQQRPKRVGLHQLPRACFQRLQLLVQLPRARRLPGLMRLPERIEGCPCMQTLSTPSSLHLCTSCIRSVYSFVARRPCLNSYL